MKHLLIDTDIGPDCDDAGALALANLFADEGLCRILGIGHCTSNPYGAGAIDVICRWYGRPNIPIGTTSKKGFLNGENSMSYNCFLTTHFANRYQTDQPEEAVTLYRRILAEEPDGTVDFVAIGPLGNLAALLSSEADGFSPLNGKELIRTKVRKLTLMGGAFPCPKALAKRVEKEVGKRPEEHAEFNILCDIPAAQKVAEEWPTPKDAVGFEAGLIKTGKAMQAQLPENHPVRIAYERFTEDGARYSWDLVTVEHAVKEDSPHYRLSEPGTICFSEDGRTLWKPEKEGRDHFVQLAQPEDEIAADIDRILVRR